MNVQRSVELQTRRELTKAMRCAIYCRVSTDRQENLNQLMQLREFAKRQGWEIVSEFSDAGISGKTGERPEFKAMFEAASKRKFDVVLFWSLDRVTREGALKTLTYLQQLSAYGCKWRSFTEAYIDSCGPFSEAIVGFLACIARQERERTSERVRAGLARARAKGRLPGPSPMHLDLNAVRNRIASGESLRGIARTLGCSPALLCKRLASPGATA